MNEMWNVYQYMVQNEIYKFETRAYQHSTVRFYSWQLCQRRGANWLFTCHFNKEQRNVLVLHMSKSKCTPIVPIAFLVRFSTVPWQWWHFLYIVTTWIIPATMNEHCSFSTYAFWPKILLKVDTIGIRFIQCLFIIPFENEVK